MNAEDRIAKRLVGIARRWQKAFRLNYDRLDDLVQSAWMLWLERPTVETERRFKQVNSGLRNIVLKEIFGRVPHQGKISEPNPLYISSEWMGDYDTDFDSYVHMARIVRACADAGAKTGERYSGRMEHAKTLYMIAGLAPISGSKKTFKERRRRLRRFLESRALAA